MIDSLIKVNDYCSTNLGCMKGMEFINVSGELKVLGLVHLKFKPGI